MLLTFFKKVLITTHLLKKPFCAFDHRFFCLIDPRATLLLLLFWHVYIKTNFLRNVDFLIFFLKHEK